MRTFLTGIKSGQRATVISTQPSVKGSVKMQANNDETRSQETAVVGPHRHFFSPSDRCLVPYAANLGYTEDDLKDDELHERLFQKYARSYGHDPAGNWILIVHADDSSEIHRFDDPANMWCCRLRPVIRERILAEAALGGQEPHWLETPE